MNLEPANIVDISNSSSPAQIPLDTFARIGETNSSTLEWFAGGLKHEMLRREHTYQEEPQPDTRLVLNIVDPDKVQSYRRKAQGTFVTTITEVHEPMTNAITTGYPYLLRALSNLVVLVAHTESGLEAHFITLEQGHYTVVHRPSHDDVFFSEIYSRIQPLASSQLVIHNVFETDLEEKLWSGDEITEQIKEAGRKLDKMNLLPAPFPIEDVLDERELRYVRRLYGIGGLSYGNLSARKDETRFWMSASGVNKGKLEVIGQDILMVSGFDPEAPSIILSVPPDVQPKRVSVDAIEHWMIYQEHPEIGAVLHVHGWMEGIHSTEFNYPCGTIQLAQAVADLLREERDPARAVIGLKNHGVTITGTSMDEIFERIEGKIVPQVPMS